eukprot:Rhum_TRINITY_DN18739_c0_g1::Rhum_TRINITY_DN18739_c0_g1_i1::g.168338::m.168338
MCLCELFTAWERGGRRGGGGACGVCVEWAELWPSPKCIKTVCVFVCVFLLPSLQGALPLPAVGASSVADASGERGVRFVLAVKVLRLLLAVEAGAVRLPPLRLAAALNQVEVDGRSLPQADGSRHLRKVELRHVEHFLHAVRSVRQQVRPVGFPGRLVQVVRLLDQLLKLQLDLLRQLLRLEVVLVARHLVLLQVLQEAQLLRQQEDERVAAGAGTGRASHAVDVRPRIIRRVELNDPVHVGDVEATGRDVRGEHDALVGVAELVEDNAAALLLQLAVQGHVRDVHVVQQLGVVLHALARGEEDDALALLPLQERVEQQEPHVGRTHDEALLEVVRRRRLVVLRLHGDVDGRLRERYPDKVLDLGRLRRGEEHSETLLRQQLQDLAHLLLETVGEDTVGLVDAQRQQVLVHPLRCGHQVVEQTARRRDDDVAALCELHLLRTLVDSAGDDAVRVAALEGVDKLGEHALDLDGQLAHGRDDDGAGAVPRHEVRALQELHDGDAERKRLAAAGLGLPEHVVARQQRRDGPPLDLRHRLVAELLAHRRLHAVAEVEVVEARCLLRQQLRELRLLHDLHLLLLLLRRVRPLVLVVLVQGVLIQGHLARVLRPLLLPALLLVQRTLRAARRGAGGRGLHGRHVVDGALQLGILRGLLLRLLLHHSFLPWHGCFVYNKSNEVQIL